MASLSWLLLCFQTLTLFFFGVQTIGQLPPAQVLMSALKVLKGKLEMVDTHLAEIDAELSMEPQLGAGVDEDYQIE